MKIIANVCLSCFPLRQFTIKQQKGEAKVQNCVLLGTTNTTPFQCTNYYTVQQYTYQRYPLLHYAYVFEQYLAVLVSDTCTDDDDDDDEVSIYAGGMVM